jgi:osmoprotectant transport system ATP-binding protein
MIEFSQVSKNFEGSSVLNKVNLKVDRGEFLVLLGASGSGKTTMLKMINGMEEPSAGEVKIHDKPLHQLDLVHLRRRIGYVIQDVGLFPHYSVFKNIGLLPKLAGEKPDDIELKVKHWMKRLDLDYEEHAKKYPENLSGGQAQRVGLARAMAGEPDIMLLDEPFSALDPLIRNQIRKDYRQIQKKEAITTVMVTHDLLEAVELADKICLIADGEIQQIDTPERLIFKPKTDKVKAFTAGDKYQATLAACKIDSLKPFVHQLPENIREEGTLLEALQFVEDKDEQILMKAFAQYKEQWRE